MTHLIRPRSASAVPPIPVAFHRLPYIMWFTAPSTLLNSVGRRALNILKASVLRGEEKRKREKNPPDTRLQSVIPVAYFPRFTERRHFNKTLNNAKTEFNRSNIQSFEPIYFVKKPCEKQSVAPLNKNGQPEFHSLVS